MTTLLIIMSEATGFFAIVIIIFLVFRVRSGIKIKKSAKQFVKRIKNEDSEHSEKLKKILLDDYSLDESEANSAVENLIQQEHQLYSKIIELYIGAKNRNLDDIDEDVKNLTKIMHGVTINSTTKTEVQVEKVEKNNEGAMAEIEKLQQELKKVKDDKQQIQLELTDAMNTMEGMMTEYASMYAGGGVNNSDLKPDEDIEKVKDKINEMKEKSAKRENSDSNQDAMQVDLNVDVPDLDVGDEN